MKKRFILTALTAALLVTAAGCGEKKETVKTGVDGRIVVDWVPQNDSPVDNDSPVVAEFEKKYDVDFNFIYMDRNQASELLNVRIAGGEIPDIFSVSDSQYRMYAKQGVLSEIKEETLKEKAPNFYELAKTNGEEQIWDAMKENGKIYGLPSLSSNGAYHIVPLWRNDWLEKVGIDKIPETVDEAEEAFYKIANEDPDGDGQKDTYAMSTFGIHAILNAYGGHPLKFYWTERDGKIIHSAVLPEMKDALIRLNKWYKDGIIDPEFITGENKGQYWANSPGFINGILGFTANGMYYHISDTKANSEKPSSFYSQFKQLQGEDATYTPGKPLVGPFGHQGAEYWGTFSGGGVVFGRNVGTDTEKQAKILNIFETLNSDFDEYIFANYGREGIEWEMRDGLYCNLVEDVQERRGLGIANCLMLATVNLEFGDRTSAPEQREYAKKHAQHVKDYQRVVWGGLPSDVMYKAIVTQKIEENYYEFIAGTRSLDEWDAFVAELNAAGLETLTKEANEWYDARYR